jgi:hypothetical protein
MPQRVRRRKIRKRDKRRGRRRGRNGGRGRRETSAAIATHSDGEARHNADSITLTSENPASACSNTSRTVPTMRSRGRGNLVAASADTAVSAATPIEMSRGAAVSE